MKCKLVVTSSPCIMEHRRFVDSYKVPEVSYDPYQPLYTKSTHIGLSKYTHTAIALVLDLLCKQYRLSSVLGRIHTVIAANVPFFWFFQYTNNSVNGLKRTTLAFLRIGRTHPILNIYILFFENMKLIYFTKLLK